MDEKSVRDLVARSFPSLAEMTYLNNASTGIPPVEMINAVNAYLSERMMAKDLMEYTIEKMTSVRERLARLLGGRPENYALMTSTSDGLNAAAHSISYRPGSNIVISDLEFPSNYIPWQHACRLYGTELRVVRSKNGAAPEEDYIRLIDDKTTIVAVSHVQFASGYRSDLSLLSESVHQVGGYLVADIIQSAGCVCIDLERLGVDFAAAQAAKWLIGPIGAGFLYVSDRAIETVTPRYASWWGMEDLEDFSFRERRMLPDARRFQTGSLPMMPLVGFDACLHVLSTISIDTVSNLANDRADYLRSRLHEEGVSHYDFGREHNSTIVSLQVSDAEEVVKRLAEERIYCSARQGRLRVSPHFYNTRGDIDRLIEHLVM
ncbi:MAG: aminotransferase class V-fold PLP-dependent enzyme [Candidatus Thorarchaeota archaeon]